ncbi:MAG: arginine--tRNA ligase [Deltaproteobacteria bacterium GWC2_55_46]|nr:MAG: arginine--tRNA ligase [Deltaproteobacteria bacterium GWA2_55_82]OGQ64359.1 MAG: arginine--tRNA ligase [Deltaproteobacteria bacterium RIFCSPLOWO2_02_FULL_55_12]OIJ72582.1 MAG: arginine--tRNA ligase [Deltaproteobacteria bacterium GWC2_55_46]
MRAGVAGIVAGAIEAARGDGIVTVEKLPEVLLDRPKKEEFGDFSTNIAMLLAPLEKKQPREIAKAVAERISAHPDVEKCEVAGPGFINIFLKRTFWLSILENIIGKGAQFGRSDAGGRKKVQVEFVSANPTGPLHIGHGRGAAVGDSLARILKAAGYEVTKEYYINDAGRQVYTLGESVRLRVEELKGQKVEFPQDYYKGEYIKDIAKEYLAKYGEGGAGAPGYKDYGSAAMLDMIRRDLEAFGITFDVWFSEKSLDDTGKVAGAIEAIKEKGYIYESEGAVWFRTTDFGDDKDRVLIKADGERTYFASDIAYHRDKAERGYDALVNIWGADHHGYEGRIRAVMRALGYDDSALKVIFIQLVALLRKGVPVPMGKREGEFVTLRQVMDEVGSDACRFFFLMRRPDAQLDFDLELAKSQAPENPVYYVQYCHARIKSIIGFAAEKGIRVPEHFDAKLLSRLDGKEETELIKRLGAFEELVERSAFAMEPHRITFYLMELAGLFHPYYNKTRVVTDDPEQTGARLLLCRAVATVVANGLALLGVSAPDKM